MQHVPVKKGFRLGRPCFAFKANSSAGLYETLQVKHTVCLSVCGLLVCGHGPRPLCFLLFPLMWFACCTIIGQALLDSRMYLDKSFDINAFCVSAGTGPKRRTTQGVSLSTLLVHHVFLVTYHAFPFSLSFTAASAQSRRRLPIRLPSNRQVAAKKLPDTLGITAKHHIPYTHTTPHLTPPSALHGSRCR